MLGVRGEASSEALLVEAQRTPLSSSSLRKGIGTLQDRGLSLTGWHICIDR